ncbi:MAG: hypothetical protein ACREQQ_01075 [Candidatus Binatia bacterium]
MGKDSRLAAAVALAPVLFAPASFADERVLLFSAYPTEQAVLLAKAAPVTEIGVFNHRRFFAGTIEGKNVIMGLTGIGMVNSERTATAALKYAADNDITVKGIIYSGVAGGPNIGDVVVPDRWTDGLPNQYPVDAGMFAVASGLDVTLNPYLPIEDAACLGLRPGLTPIRVEIDPVLRIGGLGASGDPYGERAVPCLSYAGDLIGCEACGSPLNTSPDIVGFLEDAVPFFDPQFFLDLFESFAPGGGGGGGSETPVVGDMETAAVARLAVARGIPFLAFRAVSDGGGDPIIVSRTLGFPFQFFIYEQLAADNAAAVVIEFLKSWNP